MASLPRPPGAAKPTAAAWRVYRYVAERVQAWLHGFKRPRIRYERNAFMREAFLCVACCLVATVI